MSPVPARKPTCIPYLSSITLGRVLLLLLLEMLFYVARTPTQLGVQPTAAWPALFLQGLLASIETRGRGSIPQSRGMLPAVPRVGTGSISPG